MTTVDQLRPDDDGDIYDPDDVGQHSPPFKPMKFNLEPSLSPPPNVHVPSESPESSPAGSPSRKGSARPKYHPSQSDAVLVSFMAGGKYSDIARDAGQQPLASDLEAVEEPMKGGVAVMVVEEREEGEEEDGGVDRIDVVTATAAAAAAATTTSAVKEQGGEKEDVIMAEKEDIVTAVAKDTGQEERETPAANKGDAHAVAGDQFDLKALAAGALAQTKDASTSTEETTSLFATKASVISPTAALEQDRPAGIQEITPESLESVDRAKATIPSITTLYVGARAPDTSATKHEQSTAAPATGELPPIIHSPGHSTSSLANGNGTAHITLPSISDQLGDINHLPEPPSASNSTFSQSSPGRLPPQFAPVPGHGSPPKSPNDPFTRRELPSPGRAHFYSFANNPRRPSQTDGQSYTSPADYSGSNTETPSTDQSGSTPATIGIDRMSIDGITNPQIGGFQCTYPGCTAQPFQTQYLLNSHANVHSSNRPHYCSVKGCPRSEGGKGFKRKNEMIRHGLVHDSPGYVCPFCPDREHKYPRPDNLQRHVRVHHVDKDKDDPQLREVLSQRPEGPSRGRRRRGGTT